MGQWNCLSERARPQQQHTIPDTTTGAFRVVSTGCINDMASDFASCRSVGPRFITTSKMTSRYIASHLLQDRHILRTNIQWLKCWKQPHMWQTFFPYILDPSLPSFPALSDPWTLDCVIHCNFHCCNSARRPIRNFLICLFFLLDRKARCPERKNARAHWTVDRYLAYYGIP